MLTMFRSPLARVILGLLYAMYGGMLATLSVMANIDGGPSFFILGWSPAFLLGNNLVVLALMPIYWMIAALFVANQGSRTQWIGFPVLAFLHYLPALSWMLKEGNVFYKLDSFFTDAMSVFALVAWWGLYIVGQVVLWLIYFAGNRPTPDDSVHSLPHRTLPRAPVRPQR